MIWQFCKCTVGIFPTLVLCHMYIRELIWGFIWSKILFGYVCVAHSFNLAKKLQNNETFTNFVLCQ